MELINIPIEKKILRCILFDKDSMIKLLHKQSFKKEAFSDKSIRFIYQISFSFFAKHGRLITFDILRSQVQKYSIKTNDAKLFRDKIESLIDLVIAKVPSKKLLDNFDVYVDESLMLLNGRLIQDFQMKLFQQVDDSNLDEAIRLIKGFRLIEEDEGVEQAEYGASIKDREVKLLNEKNNPELYSLLATGIADLDVALGGGFKREFAVIAGSSNAGKSMLAQQIATNSWRLKKNVILFEIGEMNVNDVSNRIDTNLASIDYGFFRNPVKNYNEFDHNKWIEKVSTISKSSGKLEIVHFRKNTTVDDLKSKTYDIMNTWGESIDTIFVDSINNISAVGKKGKDWSDYESICWELFLITKSFKNLNGVYGIPVIATHQMKKSSKEVTRANDTRALDESDVGFNPFAYQFSEVFIGMKYHDENMSELQIMKGRGINKSTGIICFNNLAMGRYHDEELKSKWKESVTEEEAEEIEHMELDNEA